MKKTIVAMAMGAGVRAPTIPTGAWIVRLLEHPVFDVDDVSGLLATITVNLDEGQ
jgi:hypothetical protein